MFSHPSLKQEPGRFSSQGKIEAVRGFCAVPNRVIPDLKGNIPPGIHKGALNRGNGYAGT